MRLPGEGCADLVPVGGSAYRNQDQIIDPSFRGFAAERELESLFAFHDRGHHGVEQYAPNALLVAVPPVFLGHWEWEDLVGSVNEALALAKLRTVEPDQLIGQDPAKGAPNGDYFQALPGILAEFTEARFGNLHFAERVASSAGKIGSLNRT